MVQSKKKHSAMSVALAAAGLPTLDALSGVEVGVLALPPGLPSFGEGLTADQVREPVSPPPPSPHPHQSTPPPTSTPCSTPAGFQPRTCYHIPPSHRHPHACMDWEMECVVLLPCHTSLSFLDIVCVGRGGGGAAARVGRVPTVHAWL
jgi:hypothetical protein